MRDELSDSVQEQSRSEGRDGAIKKLALMSLMAAKTRQEDRWPCLVRPVGKPAARKSCALA